MGNTEIIKSSEIPYDEAISIVQETLGKDLLKPSDIEDLRPPDGMYLHPEDPWHGLDHAVRVHALSFTNAQLDLVGVRRIGILMQSAPDVETIDFLGLGIAAIGHDSGRHPGCPEEEHGNIGAGRIEEFLAGIIPDVSLREAMYLTRMHVPPDHDSTMTRALKALKNGDSLDRIRANGEMWGLKPSYLRGESATLLISIARQLHAQSQKLIDIYPQEDRFSLAMEAVIRVGLAR